MPQNFIGCDREHGAIWVDPAFEAEHQARLADERRATFRQDASDRVLAVLQTSPPNLTQKQRMSGALTDFADEVDELQGDEEATVSREAQRYLRSLSRGANDKHGAANDIKHSSTSSKRA